MLAINHYIIHMCKIYYFVHSKLSSPRLSLLSLMMFDDLLISLKNYEVA